MHAAHGPGRSHADFTEFNLKGAAGVTSDRFFGARLYRAPYGHPRAVLVGPRDERVTLASKVGTPS